MISLILVDDWELRGDGSGDMEKIQFATLSRLMQIYEAHGFRGSINAEVMQQIHHLRHGQHVPKLAALAARWEEVVLDAYRRGHDVQLHVHSQWEGARYENDRWVLSGNWSILRHPRDTVVRLIHEGRTYLEGLLRRVDPEYRCVSFRSGAWAIAPSPDVLPILANEGIVFDMSIVAGLHYDNPVISLDYRHCEEPFLPYYPRMDDARRVSDKEEPLICIPTVSFTPTRYALVKQDLGRIRARLNRAVGGSKKTAAQSSAQKGGDDYQVWSRGVGHRIGKILSPKLTIGDLSALTFDMMKQMVTHIRRERDRRSLTDVPVILENHTKDFGDFSHLERFSDYLSQQDDIEVITLKELSGRFQAGRYRIARRAAS